jgi:CspA family cold shock protein
MGSVAGGVVREWHGEEGWGVIDSDETPGGCWAHLSALDLPGFRAVMAGQRVSFTFRAAAQDGYRYRAEQVQFDDEPPHLPSEPRISSAYRSSLSISWDDPAE